MAKYYFIKDGQQAGPYAKDELLAQGVDRYTNVWSEGMPAWIPAGQVPELMELFGLDIPPSQPVTVHKHLSSTVIPLPDEDIPATKPRRVKVVLLAFVIMVTAAAVAMFLITRKTLSSPEVKEDVRIKDSIERKQSEADLKEQLKAKESQHPTEFLAGEISFHDNLIGQSVIRGHVTNSATAATFKDIELTITYISKTGAPISNEIFTVYEVLKPGQSTSFKFKTRSPKGTKDAEMVVSGAKVE